VTAWHQVSPGRGVLDVADPPLSDGRYHRQGGRPTWYGSSSEKGAWAELLRNPPQGIDPREARRRLGRVSIDVVALDLTSARLLNALGLARDDLTSRDRRICLTVADVAAEAGFDALIAPSAADKDGTTLAVFGPAIHANAHDIVDYGVRTPPG